MFDYPFVPENPHGPTRYGWGRIKPGEGIVVTGSDLNKRTCKAVAAAASFCRRRPEFDFCVTRVPHDLVRFIRVPAGSGNIHEFDKDGAEESSRRRMYNFHKMQVGDSFLAPGEGTSKQECRAVNAAYDYRRRNPEFRFKVQPYSHGMIMITITGVPQPRIDE